MFESIGQDSPDIQFASGTPLKNFLDAGNLHNYYCGKKPEITFGPALPGTSQFTPASAPTTSTVEGQPGAQTMRRDCAAWPITPPPTKKCMRLKSATTT